ncbi:MAG TPA: A/G-specific adenine glycosylase [Bryobacteraceae bacterium]|nr:A/G-specific adenine glycosylase [Bryobacteraceae bacterium]
MFQKALIRWYQRHKRDLPWRGSADPYRIWISEIMLQQTRVAAVIPYYERFLERFPDAQSLAAAPEPEVLTMWAGLGYYSRARNLQKAARQIVEAGGFPRTYAEIRALAGVGDYTAAAVASIAFGLPYAVLDGNVMRVLSRLGNDFSDIGSSKTKQRFQDKAQELLDRKRPSLFNQALMELGATICLPRNPQCLLCPLSGGCEARSRGTQDQLPVKARRSQTVKMERTVLIMERKGKLLLWQRKGFWELPEPEHFPKACISAPCGAFRHSIMNHQYRFYVARATVTALPAGFSWLSLKDLHRFPISTTTRKALRCLN